MCLEIWTKKQISIYYFNCSSDVGNNGLDSSHIYHDISYHSLNQMFYLLSRSSSLSSIFSMLINQKILHSILFFACDWVYHGLEKHSLYYSSQCQICHSQIKTIAHLIRIQDIDYWNIYCIYLALQRLW